MRVAAAAAKSRQLCPILCDPIDGSPLGWLHCPWDSPGKSTGVSCRFLLQCMKVKSESEVAHSCLTVRPHGLQPPRLPCPWDFPGKSTGVGCHCFLRFSRVNISKMFIIFLGMEYPLSTCLQLWLNARHFARCREFGDEPWKDWY